MAMMEQAAAKFSDGMRQFQSKDYEAAATAFSEAIAVFPQFEPAYRLRAEAYRALGREQEASADLEAVIRITSDRLQEAERSLGRPSTTQPAPRPEMPSRVQIAPATAPSAAAAAVRRARPKPTILGMSPIILITLVITVVGVLGALVLIILAGGE